MIEIDSLSQSWVGTEVPQRYFLLDEFTDNNPQRLENLKKIFPLVDCFLNAITDNRSSDVLEPVKIRFSGDASHTYLCFENFTEGPRIDHLGEMIEGNMEADGSFSIRNSGKTINNISRRNLKGEIAQQVLDIQHRVPPKQKPF